MFTVLDYNREKAVEYAHKWARNRNPEYYDFSGIGGDCTNFTSQALYAGSGVMNYTPDVGWYYIDVNNRAAAWTGVQYLYNFLVSNQSVGPFAKEVSRAQVMPGDIVQLSFNGYTFGHSPFIVSVGSTPSYRNILVAAHTYDADYKPLSSYRFHKARFLHIEGVRTN